jgi:hypothetical protein
VEERVVPDREALALPAVGGVARDLGVVVHVELVVNGVFAHQIVFGVVRAVRVTVASDGVPVVVEVVVVQVRLTLKHDDPVAEVVTRVVDDLAVVDVNVLGVVPVGGLPTDLDAGVEPTLEHAVVDLHPAGLDADQRRGDVVLELGLRDVVCPRSLEPDPGDPRTIACGSDERLFLLLGVQHGAAPADAPAGGERHAR